MPKVRPRRTVRPPQRYSPYQDAAPAARNNNANIDLNSLDDMLLPTPPPMEQPGIWKLQRKFVKDKVTNIVTISMEWVNVLENQAVLPDYITDPVARAAAREREQLREDLIEDPFAEEQQRRQKEREMWNLKQEKRLCSSLKRKNHDFAKASTSLPDKSCGECVSHWYQYKKNEAHVKACPPCTERRNDKIKRKRKLAEEEEAAELEAASPPKKSRTGRTIKVPRRFSKEPEGRQQ
ncbi:hypothetical protein OS493_023245 [Desmophyllum pertusum]|uniref:Uncharacterized protein n=1 Tax=Desmophyllum pertusum TaxID=174260 RepID=A0A9W9YM20_9CNID|nr:hypothetical protein OS493_023245 [Desmophyllum pertusum]